MQASMRRPRWARYCNQLIARELSSITRYCKRVIQFKPNSADQGILLDHIQAPRKEVVHTPESLPDLQEEKTAVVLNGNFNHDYDIQSLLENLKRHAARHTVLLAVIYNPYFAWLYRLANRLGLRSGEQPKTFVTRVDLEHIAKLSGYHITRTRTAVYFPFRLGGIGDIINAVLPWIPGVRWLSLSYLVTLRPIVPLDYKPSLSIVIPARNEQGHIRQAIDRLPDLGCTLEVIFVEGHSKDDTWGEIQRVCREYRGPHTVKAFQQTGKGKCDAVRLGFRHATGELLTILDADLTMPPERLPAFYDAYCQGHADFINGSRLVYPMEGQAMRFLNRLGNIFFARLLSWVLDVRLGDSLCGTKLVSRADYQLFLQWREAFGDFDPFGDYELLFPAAILGLGIVDIPVRYAARQYGETNIHRFRHGLVLLRMTMVAFFRVKMGKFITRTA